jgi:hypothetical protein
VSLELQAKKRNSGRDGAIVTEICSELEVLCIVAGWNLIAALYRCSVILCHIFVHRFSLVHLWHIEYIGANGHVCWPLQGSHSEKV